MPSETLKIDGRNKQNGSATFGLFGMKKSSNKHVGSVEKPKDTNKKSEAVLNRRTGVEVIFH